MEIQCRIDPRLLHGHPDTDRQDASGLEGSSGATLIASKDDGDY